MHPVAWNDESEDLDTPNVVARRTRAMQNFIHHEQTATFERAASETPISRDGMDHHTLYPSSPLSAPSCASLPLLRSALYGQKQPNCIIYSPEDRVRGAFPQRHVHSPGHGTSPVCPITPASAASSASVSYNHSISIPVVPTWPETVCPLLQARQQAYQQAHQQARQQARQEAYNRDYATFSAVRSPVQNNN